MVSANRSVTFAAMSLVLGAGLIGPPGQGSQPPAKPRLMTVKDTQNFVSVGSPAISPDDKWVLYTQIGARLERRAAADAARTSGGSGSTEPARDS